MTKKLEKLIASEKAKIWNDSRVYFERSATTEIIGLELTQYKTGNIASAKLNGKTISNSKAKKVLGQVFDVYFDIAENKIVGGGDYKTEIEKYIFG